MTAGAFSPPNGRILTREAFLAEISETVGRPIQGGDSRVSMDVLGFDSFEVLLAAARICELGADVQDRLEMNQTLEDLYQLYTDDFIGRYIDQGPAPPPPQS